MLYDFSGGMGPQPNAPIYWLQDNLKLLLEDEGALGWSGQRRAVRPHLALLAPHIQGIWPTRPRSLASNGA